MLNVFVFNYRYEYKEKKVLENRACFVCAHLRQIAIADTGMV